MTQPSGHHVAPGEATAHGARGPTAGALTGGMLAHAADMIKCLGHPLRLRLVEGLEGGERSVTALQAYAGALQAQVSQQLAVLKARGIVACRRERAFVYYRIAEPRVHAILSCVRACERR